MATFGNLETEVEPIAGLIRDHILVHQLVTDAREALERAMAAPGEGLPAEPGADELAEQALELVRDLSAFLEEDLVIHIAKEEDVLFPALRGFAADLDKVVDEMVEQHDEIRFRKDMIARAVAHMNETHDEVREATAELAGALTGSASLAGLHDAVKRLDWIFQGHFGDEEDDLFPPALELLSPETFEKLARQANQLDRS
jgi:hemerythrin-like domain-containing protein